MDLRERLQSTLGPGYTLERELPGGGMSHVFVARDEALGRDVVIKVLKPDLAASVSLDRFTREIKVVASLQEPHIVPVLTAGSTRDGLPYFIMPFVRGESLRDRLTRGRIPAGEAIDILRNVAQALAYAHAQRIVHRDIKPENVLLSSGTAMVTDFGIARAIRVARGGAGASALSEPNASAVAGGLPSHTLTSLGTSLGTPAYMSPEQVAGDEVDHRADIYSWGVMAYELLAGAHPFAGKSSAQQLMAAHITETPRPPRDAPRGVADLVMRSLEKDPARRVQSADELVTGLGASAGGIERRRFSPAVLAAGIAVAAATFAAVGVAAWRSRSPAAGGGEGGTTRIAVIPLESARRDTSNDYLADGMSDALIQELSRFARLSVVARRSAARFKARTASPQEIGKALGVSSFVEGTLQRDGGRLRVNAQLVSTKDGSVLWSDKYDRAAGDVFTVQDDITRAIAGALRVALGGRDSVRAPSGRPTGARAAAYDLAMLGRHQAARFDDTGLHAALATYDRAIALDSSYAVPWAGKARAWLNLADDFIAPREGYPRAEEAVRRALAVDSTLAEAYSVQAWIRAAYDYDLPAAERSAEQALRYNPGDADALEILGLALSFSGRPDSALAIFRRARTVDPLNAQLASDEVRALVFAGRYDDALAAGRETLAIDPQFGLAHFFMGQAMLMQGKPAEALASFERATSVRDRGLAGKAAAYAALGKMAEARAIADTMVAESKTRYVRPEFLAWVYLSLGQRERALILLDRAYADRAGGMVYVPVDPRWAALRGDSRFEALVRRIRG